jgi:hypothetical protein
MSFDTSVFDILMLREVDLKVLGSTQGSDRVLLEDSLQALDCTILEIWRLFCTLELAGKCFICDK